MWWKITGSWEQRLTTRTVFSLRRSLPRKDGKDDKPDSLWHFSSSLMWQQRKQSQKEKDSRFKWRQSERWKRSAGTKRLTGRVFMFCSALLSSFSTKTINSIMFNTYKVLYKQYNSKWKTIKCEMLIKKKKEIFLPHGKCTRESTLNGNKSFFLGAFLYSAWSPDTLSLAEGRLAELLYQIAEGWSISVTAHNPFLCHNQSARTWQRLPLTRYLTYSKKKSLWCHADFPKNVKQYYFHILPHHFLEQVDCDQNLFKNPARSRREK